MPYPLEQINDGSIADRNFRALARDMNPPVPQARVYNNANISIATGTATALTFNTERYDNGDLHSTSANTGRLTAPITGLYAIGCCVRFAANATGYRYVQIRLNGGTTIAYDLRNANTVAGQETIMTIHTEFQLTAADYAEVLVAQTSGGNLNVESAAAYSPEFWMHRVSGFVNQGV